MRIFVSALLIAASVVVGAAQAPAGRFEEASVRPCDLDALPPTPAVLRGGGPNSFQMTPGRTHAQCMTPATLIRTAFGYEPWEVAFLQDEERGTGFAFDRVYGLGVEEGLRVRGGPAWVRSERYSIDAVAADASNAAAMSGPMLKLLLEDRFQLKAHVESEQVPAYALVIAPGGLKLKPAPQGSCEPRPRPVRGQPLVRRPIDLDAVRRGAKPPCDIFGLANGPNYVWIGGEVPLAELGRALAVRLGGVRVIDRTGNMDNFNFILEFVTDKDTPGLGPEPPGPYANANVPPAPNVFQAVQELGLRLEPARTAREFIVIDRIERPSAN